MAAAAGRQDPLIQENTVRAQQIYRAIKKEKFDIDHVASLAHAIYLDSLKVIEAEQRGTPITSESFTSIMVEFNKISALSQIQHNLYALTPNLKAHRAASEITWVECFRNKDQPTYTTDREAILTIANKVHGVLPKMTRVERGVLLSAAGARYEVECLEQAAKCLTPTDAIWKEFLSSTATLAGGAGAAAAGGKLNIGSLISALLNIVKTVKKNWISTWYIDALSIEWEATTITTVEGFDTHIQPKIEKFLDKGKQRASCLVKVFTLIFQNPKASPELKEKALKHLCNLVVQVPDYSAQENILHPEQFFKKLLNKADRYAQARSFAAMSLTLIASKPENAAYTSRIQKAIKAWHAQVQEGKRAKEKVEAEKRLEALGTNRAELPAKIKELEAMLETAVAIGAARSTEDPDPDALEEELDNLEICGQTIELTETLETIEQEETTLLAQLLEENKWQ